MLGYVNNKIAESSPAITIVPGGNPYPVNLKPWDIILPTKVTKLHPDGKKVIPAATQEEMKKILDVIPEESQNIKELSREQERIAIASLEKHCSWYQKQNGLNKIKEEKTKP